MKIQTLQLAKVEALDVALPVCSHGLGCLDLQLEARFSTPFLSLSLKRRAQAGLLGESNRAREAPLIFLSIILHFSPVWVQGTEGKGRVVP